ncbi:solute carrier family 2, facilitated glucose transporter member 8-like [Onthophagus taurus]|uniref:solute carrier family 2, facilitated glucose transporter member 8-like n=1 Tax=Onthophagus taurus TaxID=166361 RepID=UPI000C1FE4D0|nr:solute carrier family 2, facilitated glucose transporter member 8-like [Onthophagus taurus]
MGDNKPKRATQIIGALTATLGGFSLGTVLGWSSPAEALLVSAEDHTPILRTSEGGTLSQTEFTHVASILCLGAMVAQLFIALLYDKLGPKILMIILSVPFAACWFVMAFMSNFFILLGGRFILGFCGGSFCVIAPTYIGEIAEPAIRGALGICFQLMLVLGIFMEFALAYFSSFPWLCIPAAIPPIILFVVMLFMPTSPAFLIKREKEEAAKHALQFFRGKDYNISDDYKQLQDYVNEGKGNFIENMKKKSSIKGFCMLLVLHVVQQLGGINAIMFYAASIFDELELNAKHCNVGLGVVQLVFCLIVASIVDKLGRKPLWIISLSVMILCLLIVGVYYFIRNADAQLGETLIHMPVIFILIYTAGFNIASGPLPWAMIGEYLPAGVKSIIGPIITAVNWFLAYVVTFLFKPCVDWVGPGTVFLFFCVINTLGLIYVLFFLLETKNKTLDQITLELEGK